MWFNGPVLGSVWSGDGESCVNGLQLVKGLPVCS
jgi:hypothetical protein